MLKDLDAIMLCRFGEQRWISNEISGNLSLSCPGKFIWQAQNTGNFAQGDLREAVFARLKWNDARIQEMQTILENDLEIIPDGEYCLLRRHSAKLKPIYCYYSYTAKDALSDGKPTKPGELTIRHDFDELMYSGFADAQEGYNVIADDRRLTMVAIQPKPFLDRIKCALLSKNYAYEMHAVNYDLFEQDTFFISPTSKYKELFYKFPEYRYQHEGRVCVISESFSHIFERMPLNIFPLEADDYGTTTEKVYIKFDTIIGVKS